MENENVSSSRSKIEGKGKDEPEETDSQESLQQLGGQTIFAGNRLQEIPFLPVLSRGCDSVGECFRKVRAWFILDRVLSKLALPLEEFCTKISLLTLTLVRVRRNSDLAKDIFRQEQHLSPLCN